MQPNQTQPTFPQPVPQAQPPAPGSAGVYPQQGMPPQPGFAQAAPGPMPIPGQPQPLANPQMGQPVPSAQPQMPIQQAQQPQPQPGAAPQTMPPKRNPNSTQNSLLISEIRDNLAIMNDASMRAVITCRSINFDLMSAREREGVEYAYQNFLNSLYFPVQILIRSQRVDIAPYLDRLEKLRREQDNMLLGMLMEDYISFIGLLAQQTNIMDKSFFIVIPYYPTGDMSSAVNSSKNLLSNLFAPQAQQRIRIDENTFTKSKDELRNRIQTVVNGLMQMGIQSTQLSTKDLGELYYSFYNPDTAVRQPLGDFEHLGAPVITKGQGQAPQPHLDRETT